jgi:TolB protein
LGKLAIQPISVRKWAFFALFGMILLPASGFAAPVAQTGPSPTAPVILAGDGNADRVTPSASGNTVVYTDCSSGNCNIWTVNLVTKKGIAITQADYDQFNPSTDGTWVVWQDGRNSTDSDPTYIDNNFDLYAANLSDKKEFVVSDAPKLQGEPNVAGGIVVWQDYRDAKDGSDPNAGDIYMYNLATRQETRVTTSTAAQAHPVTNGKIIVWTDYRNEPNPEGFNGDIYGYDIATKQEFVVTKALDLQTDAAIYNNTVVWQDYRNEPDRVKGVNADIYGYDIVTKQEFAVTKSAGRQARPTIAGNLIAWEDYRNDPNPQDTSSPTNTDIYGYDMATKREFPVVLTTGVQSAPSAAGNTVVFEDNPNVQFPISHYSISAVTVNGVQGGTYAPLEPPVALPGAGSTTFPETGKTVTGVFYDYWNENGGLAQQGFPISEVMGEISDLDGRAYTVQYFERAVFEYHPEQTDPQYDVLLSQLGTFQYKNKYPAGAPGQHASETNSRVFPETGHSVGGKFLEYWQSHGGLAQQGFPISDEFVEVSDLNGKQYLVQYFERAVFEYHPENETPNDVLLSQLGTFQHRKRYGGQ